jgi:hypothetical protein
MLRHRKNHSKDITLLDLEEMQRAAMDFHELWSSRFAHHMPSHGHTIKYHRFGMHLVHAIKRLGATKHYSAQFFESANRMDKVVYGGTSKRNTANAFEREMVQRTRVIEAVANITTYDQDNLVRSRKTAYTRAFESGEHALPNKATRLSWQEVDTPARKRWDERAEQQDDLHHLPNALSALLEGDLPSAIYSVQSAVLNARVPWLKDEEGELQTVRATPDFHKKPVYDSVRVAVEGEEQERFAELRLIFRLGKASDSKAMAFVRWYRRTDTADALTAAGCIPLSKTNYAAISLDSIIRREYIVPDFAARMERRRHANNQFHTCVWKWSRVPIEGYTGE